MVPTESQRTLEPDAIQMRRHIGHLFEGWLDGSHEGRIELAWRDAQDGKLRHAVTFGTDELDELVERAVEENRKPGQNVYIGQGFTKKLARRALAIWLLNQMLRSQIFNTNTKAKGLRVARWPE